MSGTVVYDKDGYGNKVTWNGSSTFNVYHNGKEVDTFTQYGDDKGGPIKSEQDAIEAAAEWMKDYRPTNDDGSERGHWYTR